MNNIMLCMKIEVSKQVKSRIKYLNYRDEQCLGIVVSNLLSCMDGERVIRYSRDTGGRTFKWFYNPSGISNYRIVKTIDWLTDNGYVFNNTSSKYQLTNDRVMSICYPTELFKELFYSEEGVVDIARKRQVKAYPVLIVRDANKNEIKFKESRMAMEIIEAMEVMNLMNYQHNIRDKDGHKLDTEYHRVFNYESLHIGGRMFNNNIIGIENKVSKDRLRLTIDGYKVVEVDFGALHYRIFCAGEGIGFGTEDLYMGMLPEGMKTKANRQVVKLCTNRMLNVSSERAAMISFREPMAEVEGHTFGTSAKAVLDCIYSVYPAAKESLYSLHLGLRLTNVESLIMCGVVSVFAALDKPILPVHDSAIVRECDKELLAATMSDFYKKEMEVFDSYIVPMTASSLDADGNEVKEDISC